MKKAQFTNIRTSNLSRTENKPTNFNSTNRLATLGSLIMKLSNWEVRGSAPNLPIRHKKAREARLQADEDESTQKVSGKELMGRTM